MDFAGLNVLITHTVVHKIMRPTVVALELGEYLVNQSANIDLHRYSANKHTSDEFLRRGFSNVLVGPNASADAFEYDLICAHSQVLPIEQFDQVCDSKTSTHPVFIFHHESIGKIESLERECANLKTHNANLTRNLNDLQLEHNNIVAEMNELRLEARERKGVIRALEKSNDRERERDA